jgi:RNA polymerase sigma-70 factor (ECF subfamily)
MGLDVTAVASPEPMLAPDDSVPANPPALPEAVPSDAPDAVPPEDVPLLEKFFVRRLQKGEARAFRELVNRHQDRVFSLALRMLGDSQEAEDVSQEVFISAHRHLPRFRGDCRLSTWLYRITRNHCLNRLKYLGRRETESPREGAFEASQAEMELVAPPERPDKALLGAEERVHVHSALRQLSPEHRLLVVLRDIEGLSYEEIGRIADVPGGTIKSRLHRARAALAEVLSAAGMAPDGARPGKGG